MPNQGTLDSTSDRNQNPTISGLSGTLGPTYGTAEPRPLTLTDDGRLRIANDQSAQVTIGTIPELTNIVGGTITRVGSIDSIGTMPSFTVGTVPGIGTLTNLGSFTNGGTIKEITNIAGGTITTTLALNTGTLTTIAAGTQNTLGTVGTVLGQGTLTNVGSLTNAGTVKEVTTIPTVTTVSNVSAGSISVIVGTIGGKAASGAAAVANPIQIAGTDAGGTIYSPLVTAGGALTVTGASAGTFVNISTGTQQTLGTVGVVNNLVTGTLAVAGSVTGVGTVPGLGTLTNLGSLTNGGTIKEISNIAGGTITTTLALNTGTITTIAAGTQNTLGTVGTVAGVGVVTSVSEVVKGTTTLVSTVSNLTNGSINILTGTVQSVGTVPGVGTLTNIGSITNIGALGLGTAYKGIPAPAAGSFTAAGTINLAGSQYDAGYYDIGGTWVGTGFFEGQVGTSAFFAIPASTPGGVVGTQTIGNGDFLVSQAALDATRFRFTYSSGTLTYNARNSNFFAPLTTLTGGTLGTAAGVGVVTTVSNLTNGSANILTGTLQSSGTTTGVGVVTSVSELVKGTITNVSTGTINALAAGTITGGTLTNLVSGTINALAAGTITGGTLGNLNAGTILNSGTTTGVGVVTSVTNLVAGTITALATGTITAGTVVNNGGTVANLNYGTINIDPTPIPVRTLITSYGTAGTTGAAVFGTLVAGVGAGTKAYISGFQITGISGTADSSILIGTFAQAAPSGGTNMVTRVQAVPGGGIARDRSIPYVSGTNGTITYWIGGAGTVYFQVDYWAAT